MGYWAKAPRKREQIVLFAPTLDEMIPEDHPVRLFDEILRRCDWSDWEAEYHGRVGQPPIHPRVVAGVILYGLTRSVRSSRHLEYLLKHNIDFMWLVEGREIDHATICGFRNKFRDALKGLFRQIGHYALTMGVARLNEVALDGTRVKANNGRFETLTAEGIEARLAALDEELERMLQEAEAADVADQKLFDTGESSERLPRELADAKARQRLLQEALEKAEAADKARRSEGINPKKNPAQVPTTDPDSRVLPNKEGGYAPNYTPIATADVHGGFILDVDVIASTSEHVVTIPSMDRIEENFGEFPEAALADGAHATGRNIEGMQERDIEFFSHIGSPEANGPNPALREDPTDPVEESEKEKLPQNPQTKKFDKSAFVYDEEKDVWYCPQGKMLEYNEKKSKVDAEGNRKYFHVYRCQDCEDCPWSSDCRSEKAKRGRSVSRDEYTKSREEFAEKMSRPESHEIYKRRFHAAETPFGILKRIMNLRQFLHRGLGKVRTEWLWACTAFNLAKLIREIARLRADFSRLMVQEEG
jgi:transposase